MISSHLGEIIVPAIRQSPTLYQSWMIPVFLLAIGFVAYIRTVYFRRFQRLLASLASMRAVKQVMREELILSHRASLLLTILFALMGGLLLYDAGAFYQWGPKSQNGLIWFGIFSLAILLIYLGKLVLIKLLEWIFASQEPLQEYLFTVFSFNKFLALALLPILILLNFTSITAAPIWLTVGFTLVAVAWMVRIVRGLIIAVQNRIRGLYIILYLCALEIMPLLLFLKVAFSGLNTY